MTGTSGGFRACEGSRLHVLVCCYTDHRCAYRGMLCGRSKTQGIALSLGDKLILKQKG